MAISFNCQYCDTRISVDEKYRGKKLKCPECSLSIRVPEEDDIAQYVVAKPDGVIGPIKFIEVADMVSKGTLAGNERIAVFGTEQFKPVRQFKEFAELARIAETKAAKKRTGSMIMMLLKLGAVAGLIAAFFITKHWWDDRIVARVQDEVYQYLNRKSRTAYSRAVKEYEKMAKEFPDHERTAETKSMVDKVKKEIIELELKKYETLKQKIDDDENEALEKARQHRFAEAYKLVRRVRGNGHKCNKILVLRTPEYKNQLDDVKERYISLGKKIDALRSEYVASQLTEVDRLVVSGQFKQAKKIIFLLSKMELSPHLVRDISHKRSEIIRKSRGQVTDTDKTAPKGDQVSIDTMKYLQSGDPKKIKQAFGTIATSGRKPEPKQRKKLFSVASSSFKNPDLFFPALDAVLASGDPEGSMFRRIFDAFQKILPKINNKNTAEPARDRSDFSEDVLQYTAKHGGMDKGIFIAGLLKSRHLSPALLQVIHKHVKIGDLPNIRKAIEHIVINSKDTDLVKQAIAALGNLKSRESLDMLIMIVDYTTCAKCSFGGSRSGHTYNNTKLFCARCREPRLYANKNSLFHAALQAIGNIGSPRPLETLRTLQNKEKAAGHKGSAELIGNIIEIISERI